MNTIIERIIDRLLIYFIPQDGKMKRPLLTLNVVAILIIASIIFIMTMKVPLFLSEKATLLSYDDYYVHFSVSLGSNVSLEKSNVLYFKLMDCRLGLDDISFRVEQDDSRSLLTGSVKRETLNAGNLCGLVKDPEGGIRFKIYLNEVRVYRLLLNPQKYVSPLRKATE